LFAKPARNMQRPLPLRRMSTFREIYCDKHKCTPEEFLRRVFRKTLYPHARLFAPFILLLNYDFFTADRTLISCVAEAVDMKRVRDEVRDYFWDSENRGWLRRVANIRISGQRLKNLCRRYIPEGESAIPFPSAADDAKIKLPPSPE